MDILNSLLLWIHLVALAAGGVATFGIPVVGSKMATATPETRPLLFSIVMGMSKIGRAGLGTLIVTGPLAVLAQVELYGARYHLVRHQDGAGCSSCSGWSSSPGINASEAQAGDRAAAMRQPQIGMASMAVFLLIVLSAVFTFG